MSQRRATRTLGVHYTLATGTTSRGDSRQQILGAAKVRKTHSCATGLGLGAVGSGFRQRRTSLPQFLCLLGKRLLLPEPRAFQKSTIPSSHCWWFIGEEASFFTDHIRSTEWITAWSNLDSCEIQCMQMWALNGSFCERLACRADVFVLWHQWRDWYLKAGTLPQSRNTWSTDIYKQQLLPASTAHISAPQTCSFRRTAPRPSVHPADPHTRAKRCQAAKSKPLSHLQHPQAPRPTHTIPSHLTGARGGQGLGPFHPLQPLRARALERSKRRYEEGWGETRVFPGLTLPTAWVTWCQAAASTLPWASLGAPRLEPPSPPGAGVDRDAQGCCAVCSSCLKMASQHCSL